MLLSSAKDLDVYKKAYELAMTIFRISKNFPAEERFALTSQIRRSSRSVCLNLREAWLRPVGDVFKEKRIKPRLFVGRYLNEFSSLRD